MENLIICCERQEDQIKGYVFNCRKVAIENMQFNKLKGRNCNNPIVRICSTHKKNINKEEEEEARMKTQKFYVVWQDCLHSQAAIMMLLPY